MDPQQQMHQMLSQIGPMIFVFWGVAYFVKITLYVIPMWQTCKKAGLAPAVSLIAAVPVVGRLIVNYIIAFSDWKIAPAVPFGYVAPHYPPPAYPATTYPPQPPTV